MKRYPGLLISDSPAFCSTGRAEGKRFKGEDGHTF